MPGLNIQINGVTKTIVSLDLMASRCKDLRPAFKAAGLIVMESVNRNFMAGGRPDPWVALRPFTIRQRRGYGNPQILRDTGLLMLSIGVPGKQGINETTKSHAAIGTNVPYAAAQNFGYKNIPARPFMILQPEDEQNIIRVFHDHIMGENAT